MSPSRRTNSGAPAQCRIELRITNYELRITNCELRKKNWRARRAREAGSDDQGFSGFDPRRSSSTNMLFSLASCA